MSIEEHFKDELSSGILTFQVLNREDKKNAEIVKKYKPIGSQLFVNTTIAGTEHIIDVKDIWVWNCLANTEEFENNVQKLIAQCLAGET